MHDEISSLPKSPRYHDRDQPAAIHASLGSAKGRSSAAGTKAVCHSPHEFGLLHETARGDAQIILRDAGQA